MTEKGRNLARWGATLQVGVLIGVIGTVAGMSRAFIRLAQKESTEAIQSDLAYDIAIAIYSQVAGTLLSGIGVILLLIALCSCCYRAKWFRSFMWIISFIWLLYIPLGTIVGIIVIVYLINHKSEFHEG